MILGLMRVPEERWSFDKYFTEVDKIVNKKIIYVFNMNTIEMLHVSIILIYSRRRKCILR